MIPPTPGGSVAPPTSIAFDEDFNQVENTTPSVLRLKRNLGKLRLFTLGYTKADGAKILPLRATITELFSLAPKDMSKAFGNQFQSTSETQGNSMDCVNRQTSLPDWTMTP